MEVFDIIGEVSEMFHLPVSTLRYYDKEGLFPDLERKGNIRYFSDNELEIMKSTRRGYYINDQEKHQICLFFQNNAKIFNKVIDLVKASLLNINLELSDRNIRIAKRLYYRYDSPEITSLYNY